MDGRVAEPDGSVDAAPCTAGFLDTCAASPMGDLMITANVGISTDTDTRCRTVMQPGGPNVCLMVFRDVQIATTATLFAHGSRPLAIAARRTMNINGTVDVASRRGSSLSGAGSGNSSFCASGIAAIDSMGGAGGGGGGSYRTSGGEGGRGNLDGVGGGASTVPGGVSGPSYAAPAFLRGGCHGQNGGVANVTGGIAGLGGGGVYLHAPTLTISGDVFAGGGGGGGGLDMTAGLAGVDGRMLAPAAGGTGSVSGGDGGAGATTAAGVAGEYHNGGGGGGGGGTGLIILIGATSIEGLAMPPFITR